MSASIRELYEISFESDAAASYLVIKTGIEKPIRHYQVEMIAHNRIERILPFDLRQKNDQNCFYYNVTSKLTLSRIFKNGKIKRNQFIRILSDITRTLLDCHNYLLNDQCLVLEEDFIYVNPATFELSMVYIPISREDTDAVKRFREFILNLITGTVDIDYGNGDNFLHRILSFVKSELFNATEFYSLLQKLLEDGFNNLPGMMLAEQEDIRQPAVEKPGPAVNPQIQGSFTGPKALPESKKKTKEAARPVEKVVLTGNGLWKLLLAAAIQIAFVVAIVLLRDTLNNLNKDRVTTYVAVALIVISLDVLLFRKLFGGGGIVIRKKTEKTAKIVLPTPPLKNKELAEMPTMTPVAAIKDQAGSVAPVANVIEKYNEKMPEQDETVLLVNRAEKYAYLQSTKGSRETRIILDKPDFLIGRLHGQVNHVLDNNAVGKVHAQIVKRDGNYFLTDLNSRNGTFINNVRVVSSKEYAIHHNDRITFANCEYVFIDPESGC